MTNSVMQKQALGRVSHLGHLYDERTESFLGYSLFKSDVNDAALKQTDTSFTDTEFVISASMSKKLQKLSADSQLKLSVMAGALALEGSARYLSDKNESSDSVTADLIYKMITVKEEVDIARLPREVINCNSMGTTTATHLVVGIKWGAHVIGSLEYEKKNDENKQAIEGIFQLKIFLCNENHY